MKNKTASKQSVTQQPSASTPQEVEKLIYTKSDLTKALGLSRATIDNMRRNNEFPAPIVLAARKVGWTAQSIKEWIASRQPSTGIY